MITRTNTMTKKMSRREAKAQQVLKILEQMSQSKDPCYISVEVPLTRRNHILVECERWDIEEDECYEESGEEDEGTDAPPVEIYQPEIGEPLEFQIYIVDDLCGETDCVTIPCPVCVTDWKKKALEDIDYLLKCATNWD